MNYRDAFMIADDWRKIIEPVCTECVIVGSVRRKKQDAHDVELLAIPIQTTPRAIFGDLHTFATPLDKLLYEKECDGVISKIKAGPKYKQYGLSLGHYGLTSLNVFKLELYLVTPPAQWGVGMVIRTGPGSEIDNFSKYCVTNKQFGGAMPDGYKQKHLAVWRQEQLNIKGEPKSGEIPLSMPQEGDFLSFLGMEWIEPQYRHAPYFGERGK